MNKFLPIIALSLLTQNSIAQDSFTYTNPYGVNFHFQHSNELTLSKDKEYLLQTSSSPYENKDLTVLSQVGKHLYIVKLNKIVLKDQLLLALYPSELKINVAPEDLNNKEIVVELNPGIDLLAAKQYFPNYNVKGYLSKNTFVFTLNTQQSIQKLAENPYVRTISILPKDEPLLYQSRGFENAVRFTTPLTQGGLYGLSGKGVSIGVGDDSNPSHIDLTDRSRKYSPLNQSAHGSHTSGIAAGAGIINEYNKGLSVAANVFNHYYSYVLEHTDALYKDYNVNLTNNSYGANLWNCNYLGIYDQTSKAVDELALSYPKVLHVFAAGNSQQFQCGTLPYGYGTIAGHYQTAKNVLTVAAIGKTIGTNPNYTSTGPTKDGRLKPEIAAVGHNVVSTGNNNNYFSDRGTSMAAPQVTGAAGLLTEYYKSLHNDTLPDASYLKTVLLAGTDDINSPGPDYRYGFGIMNVGNSLDIIKNNQIFSKIYPNTNTQFSINVPSNVKQLKVLLYWEDSTTTSWMPHNLSNDLDLTITDPNNAVHLPWVLDPANPTAAAVRGADHANNVEMITIDNPTPGTYTGNVTNTITTYNAKYFVAYQYVYDEIAIKHPSQSVSIPTGVTETFYWRSEDISNPIALDISYDNGNSWQLLNGNIPAAQRHYDFVIPNNISTACKIRITQGSRSVISETFQILTRPNVTLAAAGEQCPGSINIKWNKINAIDSFVAYIYRRDGQMHAVDTITDTTYRYTNLSLDTTYWVGVASLKNNKISLRSISVSRKPNTGTCGLQDLIVSKIMKRNGRQFTQKAFSSSENLPVYVANVANTPMNNGQSFDYVINTTAFTHNNSAPLAASYQGWVNIPNVDLSASGTYDITAKSKANDIDTSNNTAAIQVKHIENAPLDLSSPFKIDFENDSTTIVGDTVVGWNSSEHLDCNLYPNTGRMTTFVSSNTTLNGNKSLTLDQTTHLGTANINRKNEVIGTFNLSQLDTTEDFRISFKYRLTGQPFFNNNNAFYVRASDTSSWHKVIDFVFDSLQPYKIHEASALRIGKLLKDNNEPFNSTSFQFKIEQNDISVTGGPNLGWGLTIDDIELFLVKSYVSLDSVHSLPEHLCLENPLHDSLRYYVRNIYNQQFEDIKYGYTINQVDYLVGSIDSIGAYADTVITMPLPPALFMNDSIQFKAWLFDSSDSAANRINQIDYNYLMNNGVVSQFPYLERFDTSNGNFYTRGENSSWIYYDFSGDDSTLSPTVFLRKAASGNFAWRTGASHYNNFEQSYLYTPCFDISSLTQPMLSMSFYYNIDKNEVDSNYDYFQIEYSQDGITWLPITTTPESYRWNNTPQNTWSGSNEKYWHVISTPIVPTNGKVSFRMALHTNGRNIAEGVAIDDVHIYEKGKNIYANQENSSLISQNINTNTKVEFEEQGQIFGSILSNATLGTTTAQSFYHDYWNNSTQDQYIYPQHINILPESANNCELQWFVKDSAARMIENGNICPTCPKPLGMYNYQVSVYTDKLNADSTWANNKIQEYKTFDMNDISITPYLDGYIYTIPTKDYGEFWLHHSLNNPQNNVLDTTIQLSAYWTYQNYATVKLDTRIDNMVRGNYDLYVSKNDGPLEPLGPMLKNGTTNIYYDTRLLALDTVYKYVAKYKLYTGQELATNIATLSMNQMTDTFFVYPNPTHDILNVIIANPKEDTITVNLFNTIGQNKYHTIWDPKASHQHKYRIPMKDLNLSSGIYMLQLQYGDKEQKVKIVFAP